MNSQLARQMTRLAGDPFLATLQELDPGQKGQGLDGSMIQAVLNRQHQEAIVGMLQRLPMAQREAAMVQFRHFLHVAKESFSTAVDNIFFVSGILMLAGLAIVLFLPEIPLRKSERPVLEDVGVGLEEDFAQADDRRQQRRSSGEAA
ncbi:MAG: transporter [Flaviaesturariibacter sp.]|nr:transporter [Flaviaesturariibacter sp.]